MAFPGDGDDEFGESDDGGALAVDEGKPDLQEPPKFVVLLHNDDYSTMEFVIEVLRKFFKKTEAEAMELMLKVHHEGKAVAGIFSREIAETKVVQVNEYGRVKGHPLRCTAEPL